MRNLDTNELEHVYGGGRKHDCHKKHRSYSHSKNKSMSKSKSYSHSKSRSRHY